MQLAFVGCVIHYGGAQRCTAELCRDIVRQVDLHVIDAYGSCAPYNQAIAQADCPYHILRREAKITAIGGQGTLWKRLINVSTALPGLIRVASALGQMLRKIQPDIVCVNDYKSLHLLRATCRHHFVPVVYYLHGNYRPDQIPFTARYLFREYVRHFIAVSTVTKQNVCRIGVAPELIDVIFNPVDRDDVLRRAQKSLMKVLPGLEAEMRLLLPGTLVPGKGQLCAVRALKILLDKGHDAILWLAGDVPSGAENGYLNQIKREIDRWHLSERVFILGWRDDVLPIMSRATTIILPSYTEGMPVTVLEAMALGKPVAATGVGGIPDLIVNKQTGLIIDIDDAEGLAQAVIQYLDTNFRECIKQNALEHIRQHCDPTKQRTQVLDVLAKVCGT